MGIIWQNWACLHWIILKKSKTKKSAMHKKKQFILIYSVSVPYVQMLFFIYSNSTYHWPVLAVVKENVEFLLVRVIAIAHSYSFLFVVVVCVFVCLLLLLFWRGGGRWVQFLSLPTSHPPILSPTVFNIKLFTYWYQKVIMMMMMVVIISTNTVENVVVYCGLMYCW